VKRLKKKQSKKKSGVTWVFAVVSLCALVIVLLLGFQANSISDKNQAEKAGAEAEQKEVSQGEQIDESMQQFIGKMHAFYNETTGYGEIEQLNWEDQMEQADEIIEFIESEKDTIDHEAFEADLKAIVALAHLVAEEQDKEQVRQLHRYFHDLDIIINDYDESNEIWNVTETLHAN